MNVVKLIRVSQPPSLISCAIPIMIITNFPLENFSGKMDNISLIFKEIHKNKMLPMISKLIDVLE